MKKLVSVLGLCAVCGLTACNADDVAKNGDRVVINFAGFSDGVQFPGGTADGVPLVLGSGQFIPGFEEQVVGMKIGEERDVNVTFPETYHATELAGRPAVFKVKLVEIVE